MRVEMTANKDYSVIQKADGARAARRADKEAKRMTPADVIRRLDAGEDPLDLSVEHWEEVCAADTIETEEVTADYCALCTSYGDNGDWAHECDKCPMFIAGYGCQELSSSPWYDALQEIAQHKAPGHWCRAMLNVLKELKAERDEEADVPI